MSFVSVTSRCARSKGALQLQWKLDIVSNAIVQGMLDSALGTRARS
jgi:hypothetical protein